jgi:transposase
MCAVPKPFPKEFRDDVVNVARNRGPGVTLRQIAEDFGISETCLGGWVRAADVEDGIKPASSSAVEATENRELRKRVRLLEQENEVLRRAAAYLSQAHLPGK